VKLFGHWGNFKDYVEGAVGMSERQAYRLIAGYEIDQLLRRNSCRPPSSERQVRALAKLKLDELRPLAWNRACKLKHDSDPTYQDVWREVKGFLEPVTEEETDERFRQYGRRIVPQREAECEERYKWLKVSAPC